MLINVVCHNPVSRMEDGEHEDTEDQSCVKSILSQRQCSLRSTINELIQFTSEVECRGSSIYTLVLFRCFENHGVVPLDFFKQGFVYSCFAAASTRSASTYKPDPLCDRYKQEAMRSIPPVGTERMYMSQTINSLARRYITSIKNSFILHLRTRQVRAVRFYVHRKHPGLSKSASSFLTNHIIWKIRGQPIRSNPDSTKYKDGTTGLNVLTDDHDSFIASHLTRYERLADMSCDGYVGYFSDRNIKKHTLDTWCFFMMRSKHHTQDSLQVVPQYGMKLRVITIGKNILTMFCTRVFRYGYTLSILPK